MWQFQSVLSALISVILRTIDIVGKILISTEKVFQDSGFHIPGAWQNVDWYLKFLVTIQVF